MHWERVDGGGLLDASNEINGGKTEVKHRFFGKTKCWHNVSGLILLYKPSRKPRFYIVVTKLTYAA